MSFEIWVVEDRIKEQGEKESHWEVVETFLSAPTKERIESSPTRRVRRYIPQMIYGGGSLKGAGYERDIGWYLSKWLSNNTRTNLIRRTVLSGGQYTQGEKKGVINPNPGDLTANDPLAFPFFDQVVIECKSWKYVELIDFIQSKKDLFLAMQKVQREALAVKKMWMLVFKQNSCSDLVLLPTTFKLPSTHVGYHRLHDDSVYLVKFADLLKSVPPIQFIELASKAHD